MNVHKCRCVVSSFIELVLAYTNIYLGQIHCNRDKNGSGHARLHTLQTLQLNRALSLFYSYSYS